MQRDKRPTLLALQRAALLAGIATVALAAPVDASFFHPRSAVVRPAPAEFGLGPRDSAKQLYKATLVTSGPLRLRQLQTMKVMIVDARGRPVDNATIAVDGGMPEHAHGLPTRPRVARTLGAGSYEIEGLRFSMGGWWELKLAIDSPAGADDVTFNLSL